MDNKNCYFCQEFYDKSRFWQIGNIVDDEAIWLCYDCMSEENISKWLRGKGIYTEFLPPGGE
ncbi:MAG: hypothetical protein GWN00_12745 [Aliifodinibius sp.]|nr:hypothetical protein [Fodinibius sp.]NIV11995.1 hypothetical protein [Fodinibius sp.]NIY25641.1 hypothetical protein [Fodinibius sp.]